MSDALTRSGYLVETKVDGIIRRLKLGPGMQLFVQTNTPYQDPSSGKSRENDVHVWITDAQPGVRASAELLVECINNPQPLAFFARGVDSAMLEDRPVAGYPLFLIDEASRSVPLLKALAVASPVELFAPVARQYCTFSRKKGMSDWMASHADEQHAVFSSLVAGISHHIGQHYAQLEFDSKVPSLNVYYGILVTGGELVRVNGDRDAPTIERVDQIVYMHSTFDDGRQRDWPINVVTESAFESTAQGIIKELETIGANLQFESSGLIRALGAYSRRVSDYDGVGLRRLLETPPQ